MGYAHGDSFPSDFEPNGVPFGSKSKGKLSPGSYPIQYEWKWKYSFLTASEKKITSGSCLEYLASYLHNEVFNYGCDVSLKRKLFREVFDKRHF